MMHVLKPSQSFLSVFLLSVWHQKSEICLTANQNAERILDWCNYNSIQFPDENVLLFGCKVF